MALQKQTVAINFSGGMDTKTDPKQVVPGKLTLLENGIYTSLKRIKKRNGYSLLSQLIEGSPLLIDQGVALANFKDELILFDGKEAFSYSPNTERWTDKGKASSISLSAKSVIRNTFQQTTCDSAFHPSGLEVFTWEDSRGGARYSVVDSTTGETIISDTLIHTNAKKPKPFALGNYLIIIFHDDNLNQLRKLVLPSTSPSSASVISSIALDLDVTNPSYDATCDGNRIYVAYNNSDVSGGISLFFINKFLSSSAHTDVTGENADSCISVCLDASPMQVWVSYHNGTQIKYFIYSYALDITPILSPTLIEANGNTINNITMFSAGGEAELYYTQNAVIPSNNFILHAHLTNAGVVTDLAVFLRSVGIASKPFLFNDALYLSVTFESSLQSTYFVINTSNATIEAKFSPELGGGLLEKNIIPESNSIGNNMFLIAALQKDFLTTISGTVFTQTGVRATIIDFSTPPAFDKIELGENLHIAGGILHMYDGIAVVEHNFHVFPEDITSAPTTGSGSITAGTRQYVAVYEWMDNQGQIHYSAPSVPVTQINTTANSYNTLTIPTLRLTDKTGVTIGIYRTQDSQTQFTKITSITSPLLNDPTVDTVMYVDSASDASILGNQELYTTGGVIENIAAPACNFVTTYKDRIILLPAENPNQYWFSKQLIPGNPVEFTDSFVKNVDQAGGALVGAARLDTVLVLFKETQLYYVTGTGPDSTGTQDDFSDPQPIACDGGCVDKKSIILTPSGLMYKSQKGIYLLGRDLQSQYIGADVEAYNSNQIIAASLISDTTQIRFCLNNGIALVFDYYVGQWSVFTNHNAVDAIIWQEKFVYLTATGKVMQEIAGLFTDNGAFIPLKLVTSWLSLANLDAYQRVYRLLILGEYMSRHSLRVSAAYDFNPFSTQETIIPVGALLQPLAYGDDAFYGQTTPYGGAYPGYNFKVDLSRQKCTSIQFTMYDTQTSNFGEGLSLSAMALEVGVKQGTNKLPAARSFG